MGLSVIIRMWGHKRMGPKRRSLFGFLGYGACHFQVSNERLFFISLFFSDTITVEEYWSTKSYSNHKTTGDIDDH